MTHTLRTVEMYLAQLPLVRPFTTSSHTKTHLDHILIRVVDQNGAQGWGECASASDPYYCSETSETSWHILRDFLIPGVLGQAWDHPDAASSTWAAVRGNRFAKAGLEMLVRCAAEELGRHKIRVNAVRPGLTRTDATVGMFADDATVAAYMEQQPLDRDGEAEDIAGAIRYFAGPESTWTTGQCLTVDGGCSLRRFPDLTPLHVKRLGDELEKAAHGIVD